MKYRCLLFLVAFCAFTACKNINPDKPALKRTPIALPKTLSTINIPLEIPFSYLEDHLNKGLKELMFSEKGLNISKGILTDIDVFRTGQIKLSAKDSNNMLIKLPMRLKGTLNIEKKIFGQTISTAIPFDENLLPAISFSPEIGKNWDLSINNLKIESWGRPLQYNLLGYKIDLDPIIRPQIEKMLNDQLGSSGLSRISFKNFMNKTWQAYSKPFQIQQGGLDAYIYTIPHKIKIKEQLTEDEKLKLFIGMEGEVITRLGDRPNISPSPLPSLYPNEDTVNHFAITLPLAISYPAMDEYLNKKLSGESFKIDSKSHLIPEEITTQAFGDRALVKLNFILKRNDKKDLKGELFLVGKPSFDQKDETVVFDDIDFDINTKNILARSAGWLKQEVLLTQIKKHAVYPIGPYLEKARAQLQKLGYIPTDFASFRVTNPQLNITGIYVTEQDIRLYIDTKGKMDVNLKNNAPVLD